MSLLTWGRGKDNRLGHDDNAADKSSPTPVAKLNSISISKVALGACHGSALTADGEVHVWGGGAFGELGLGDDVEESPSPRKLPALAGGQRVVDLSCGFYHTACVTAEGGVWTWGWGRDGQLGHSEASATPRRVEGTLRQVPCRAVACGHHATSVLSNEGDAYLWGALRDGGQQSLHDGTAQN